MTDRWSNFSDIAENYYITKDPKYIHSFLEAMDSYVKSAAKQAHNRSTYCGLHIPKEDFYSHFLTSIWQAILDYSKDETHKYKLKNVVLKRLNFAEKTVWRNYKNGKQYDAAKWSELGDSEITSNATSIEESVISKDILKTYIKKYPKKGIIIYLLFSGYWYSPSEVVKLTKMGNSYTPTLRKRIQRVRVHFYTYLNNNKK
ncbi:MAG: hypothetical protein ACK5NA_07830 [Enterococcus sp.]